MHRLHVEWQRLFAIAPAPTETATPPLIDGQGRTRTLVLGVRHPAGWDDLSPVWQAVQAEGGLPAPGIAVSGTDSHLLWFSLAEPVPLAEAHAFLVALSRRCLAHLPTRRLSLWPTPDATRWPDAIPAQQGDAEHWSAFVAPDLAPMFADTPWLDLPPNPDGQAELLARLRSITPSAWLAAQAWLQAQNASDAAQPSTQAIGPALNPHTFLHQVMNDATVPLALRIEAAKALLLHDPHTPPAT